MGVAVGMSVTSLQQTHKLLYDKEGDDPTEDPQAHGHHVTVGGACGEQTPVRTDPSLPRT